MTARSEHRINALIETNLDMCFTFWPELLSRTKDDRQEEFAEVHVGWTLVILCGLQAQGLGVR